MKYLSMLLMMVALSVCMVSCGSDDEESLDMDEIGNFYIEYEVTGGGLTSATLSAVKSQIESEYGRYVNGIETKEAIYAFKELVKDVRDDFSNGVTVGGAAISGTLKILMVLKTEDGKFVKQGIVYVTKDGSSYEV